VPVLARAVEAAGIPTVTVTMMPDLAEKYGLARIVGVEFPFGHPFGLPKDRGMPIAVARTAIGLYDRTVLPARADVPITWPVDFKLAYRSWQPKEIAPIVAYRKQQFLERRGRA
jgi:hypothetical protein